MNNDILEALSIIEEEKNRTEKDIEIIRQAKQEIERLNNIINELEKYIEKNKHLLNGVDEFKGVAYLFYYNKTDELLDKLKELKGSDKE